MEQKIYHLILKKAVMNGYGSSVSDPAVGIAHRKLLFNDRIRITIAQLDKDGHPLFPYEYEITSTEALNYPKWLLPDGITPVHIIPIRRLTQLISDPNPKCFKTTMKKANTVAKKMSRLSASDMESMKRASEAMRREQEAQHEK